MSKAQQIPTPHGSAMKALIIYDDFAFAVRASVALQHSARNAEYAVQWNVNPWPIDMLKFSPKAEEALTDALGAHLIVVAGRSAKSPIFWFHGWLEHWAKCHQIKGAALALFGVGCSDSLAAATIAEFSSLARRHGLSLIFDDARSRKDRSNFNAQTLGRAKIVGVQAGNADPG
jgi:hypothetical protein